MQVNLTARRFHHLVLEYREMRESAHCRLWWSSPSTPFQVSRDFTPPSAVHRLLFIDLLRWDCVRLQSDVYLAVLWCQTGGAQGEPLP